MAGVVVNFASWDDELALGADLLGANCLHTEVKEFRTARVPPDFGFAQGRHKIGRYLKSCPEALTLEDAGMRIGFQVTDDRCRAMTHCHGEGNKLVFNPDGYIESGRAKGCTDDFRPMETLFLLFPEMIGDGVVKSRNSHGQAILACEFCLGVTSRLPRC